MPNRATTTPTSEAPASPQPPDQPAERITDWPPADAFDRAEKVKRQHGYDDTDSPTHGRLNAAMVTQLARVAQTIPTPDTWITTEVPTDGKPYTSTGLTSLQPQIDVMNAIFGPPHWRLRARELEDGVLDLELVVGNDLDAAPQASHEHGDRGAANAEVLLCHRMRGSHSRGRSHADRYKGALTNGGKRLLAMAGACADVGRFAPEPDEAHNTPAAGARDRRKPTDKQVAFLARLVRENAGSSIERWITRLQQLADVEEQVPEPVTETYVRGLLQRLDREQAKTMIDALIAVRDTRTATAAPSGQGPIPAASANGDAAPPTSEESDSGNGQVVTIDFAGIGPSDPPAA